MEKKEQKLTKKMRNKLEKLEDAFVRNLKVINEISSKELNDYIKNNPQIVQNQSNIVEKFFEVEKPYRFSRGVNEYEVTPTKNSVGYKTKIF